MDPQANTPSDAKTNARRRLIRGSFSVPAVLAVHNGSALAATSNKFRCAINATSGTGITLPQATTMSDGFSNTRVTVYERGQNQYVSVAELKAKAGERGLAISLPSGSPSPANTDGWVEYKLGGTYAYANVGNGFSPSATTTKTAVLFAPDGGTPPKVLVVGFVQPGALTGSNFGAVPNSCWASFA